MNVQKIITKKGEIRYLVMDDDDQIIEPVHRYIRYLDSMNRSIYTIKSYCSSLKIYFEFLQKEKYTYLTILDDGRRLLVLTDFMGYLRRWRTEKIGSVPNARSERTINTIMAAVIGFYRFLELNGDIPQTGIFDTEGVKRYMGFLSEMHAGNHNRRSYFHLREKERKIDTCTREQVIQIVNACDYLRDKLLILCMYEGGLRLGETLNLYVSDFQIWQNRIILKQHTGNPYARIKNQSEAALDMPPYVMQLFCRFIAEEYPGSSYEYVFLNYKGPNKGLPLSEDTVEKKFQQLSAKCGFHIHPHQLRHSHATELIEKGGWDILDVKERLRHKNVQTTIDSYIALSDGYKKRKFNEFQEKIRNDL